MIRKFAIILLMFSLAANLQCRAAAREKGQIRAVEFEIGGGLVLGHGLRQFNKDAGLSIHLEARYNIPEIPMDIGFQASIFNFNRDNYNYSVTGKGTFITFVDYNFRYFKRIDFFAGLGLGMGAIDYEYPYESERGISFSRSMVLNPRIGIELFHHLRITAEYKWMRRHYSYAGINIGVVFGGGKKK